MAAAEDQAAQAAQIWSMLDDMAENDPAAYRKFIDKQLKEGKEANAPPSPHMCVQTCIASTLSPVFINFCGWSRVPKPKDDNAPIPCHGSSMTCIDQDDEKAYYLAYVAFNPAIVKQYGKSCKNKAEQDALIQLAIKFTEDQNKIHLSKHYAILEIAHKGEEASLSSVFGIKKEGLKEDIENLAKMFAPINDILTRDPSIISDIDKSGRDNTTPTVTENITPDIRLPGLSGVAKPSKLIEEVKVKPNFQLSTKEADGIDQRKIVVKIDLDDINTVEQCVLDVSQTTLTLEALAYHLYIQLPEAVDDDKVRAKFSKSKHRLTVTLPVTHKAR